LRVKVLADSTANPVLLNLAADAAAWQSGYLAALEEGGLIRPVDEAPPIRSDPKVQSLLSILATGVIYGPSGSAVIADGDLMSFFANIHKWYGDQPGTMAPIDHYELRKNEYYSESIPVPALASYDNYDEHLTHPTYLQNVNVFVPWVPFE